MRKLLLLLIALLTGVSGVWADGFRVSTTESASAEYQYKIFCRGNSSYYLGATTNATNSSSEYGLFAFYASDPSDGYTNGYYIYSVSEEKWVTYTPAASYTDGQNKISLSDDKPTVPWNIAADNTDNYYYDIRAFKTDKTVALVSWNWYNGAGNNTTNTMGFYSYTDNNSGWGFIYAGGSTPYFDRKVVALYNRVTNGDEYPAQQSGNDLIVSNTTDGSAQLFVLLDNGTDASGSGEPRYNLMKAEADGKYLLTASPTENTFSTTAGNYIFLNSSCKNKSYYEAKLKDGHVLATSPYYNFIAENGNYRSLHSQCDGQKLNGWTDNQNSSYKIHLQYAAKGTWNGLWTIKEQSYTAWQVVITGASGSITYTGSSLLSGATATQANNGFFVLNSAATPTTSEFTINNVNGYCTDPSISIDANLKLIKVAYTNYSETYNTITTTLEAAPEGLGYPTMTARAKLQDAIDAFDASKTTANLTALSTQYNSFLTSVALPELGKVYTIQNYIKSPSKTTYLKNVSGTLTIGTDADGTALNNLWIVRKSGSNNVVLQSAADLSKYIVYTSFTLAATGSAWELSQGTEWPYISMYNSSLGGGRFVACNGSDQFGTAGGSGYYGSSRTQYSGWSTDFMFVESTDYALYKVKIIYPEGSSPTVTYNETAYSNGDEFLAATGLTTASLSVSEVAGYTHTISIDDDIIYVTYNMTLNQTYADTWHFDANPWTLLQEVPASLPTGRTYRYNTKRLHITTDCNSTIAVKFAYFGNGSYRIDVAGVDLINPSTGEVVKADYHDGYSGGAQSNRDYVITDVAPGDYILRYISWSQSTSSDGNITIKITPATGFYRIKNNGSNNYLAYGQSYAYNLNDPRDIGLIATSTSDDAASVIKLTGSNGTYKLSVQGLNIQSQTTANTVFPGTADTGVDFAFNIASSGVVSITNSGSRVDENLDGSLHEATDGWTVHGVVNWSASAGNSKWVIEKATSVTLTLNDGKDGYYYATGYWPFDVTITSADAFTLAQSGSYLVPTAVTGNNVPAGTPVLLKGASATATATINTGSAFSALGVTNALTGTYTGTTINGANDYVLGINNGVVGFYHWNSNNLGANRAYLDTPAAGVKGFVINWGGETGVEAIEHSPLTIDHEAGAMFDLSGRRVSKAQKGLYIQNGKKVMVK